MVRHLRFHGRGGEGVKLTSRIVSRAAFLTGSVVQDSPLYGAERRGAPVVAFVRLSEAPIRERGYITTPDAIVLLDDSMPAQPDVGVLEGMHPGTLVLVNSTHSESTLQARYGLTGRLAACDVSSLALRALGEHVLSAPMAGFTARAAAIAGWEPLAAAVRAELQEAGLASTLIERNIDAAREAFNQSAVLGFAERPPVPSLPLSPAFTVPHLAARFSAPSIAAAGTAALRHTEGWRVYRPVIERPRCTHCLLCFVLCPESAIQLDADHYPVIDYEHCKGCLVCAAECPPQCIRQEREVAA